MFFFLQYMGFCSFLVSCFKIFFIWEFKVFQWDSVILKIGKKLQLGHKITSTLQHSYCFVKLYYSY